MGIAVNCIACGWCPAGISVGVVGTQLVSALQSNAIMDNTSVDLSVSSARDALQGNIVKDAGETLVVPVPHALTALIRRPQGLRAATPAKGVLQESTAKAVRQVRREAVNLALPANTRRHRDLQHVRSVRPANILWRWEFQRLQPALTVRQAHILKHHLQCVRIARQANTLQ